MACPRIAEAVGFKLSPLNVRVVTIEKLAGDCGFLPVAISQNNFSSDSVSHFDSDFSITGGLSWRRIS
jgi:hypothetical protein